MKEINLTVTKSYLLRDEVSWGRVSANENSFPDVSKTRLLFSDTFEFVLRGIKDPIQGHSDSVHITHITFEVLYTTFAAGFFQKKKGRNACVGPLLSTSNPPS